MVENVVHFPGTEGLTLNGDCDPRDVLVGALEAKLKGVVILGFDDIGQPYFASSYGDQMITLRLIKGLEDILLFGDG